MENTNNVPNQEGHLQRQAGIPEVLIDRVVLYHGSRVPDMDKMLLGKETTLGKGAYLTSDPIAAEGYAVRRSKNKEGTHPFVYKVEVANIKLADLRHKQGVVPFAQLLSERLKEKLLDERRKWYQIEAARRTIEKIDKGLFSSLKDITWNHQDVVTDMLKDAGFDGLIAIEGGEGEEVREHDSYVVFDPTRITNITKFN